MPRLRIHQLVLTTFLFSLAVPVLSASPSAAANGGGAGTGGSSIWAATWWNGNPQGPGPYIPGEYDAAEVCNWTDVGSTVGDVAAALATADLPASFWPVVGSGYTSGALALIRWAERMMKGSGGGDHFDVVACESPAMVPESSGEMYTDIPPANPPSGPQFIWVFWDTVPGPPAGTVPPLVGEALQRADLPAPKLDTSPKAVGPINDATVVNFPTWLWINAAAWRTIVASAAGGGLVATVWAIPQSVTWHASWDYASAASDPEGGVDLAPTTLDLVCGGPGTPYTPVLAGDAGASSPDCGSTFTESTFGDWIPLRASITWDVWWTLTNTAGVVGGEGELSPSVTSSTRGLRVLQVESVVSTT
jgi:hypothetical protein